MRPIQNASVMCYGVKAVISLLSHLGKILILSFFSSENSKFTFKISIRLTSTNKMTSAIYMNIILFKWRFSFFQPLFGWFSHTQQSKTCQSNEINKSNQSNVLWTKITCILSNLNKFAFRTWLDKLLSIEISCNLRIILIQISKNNIQSNTLYIILLTIINVTKNKLWWKSNFL